jgi:hypothetical protein
MPLTVFFGYAAGWPVVDHRRMHRGFWSAILVNLSCLGCGSPDASPENASVFVTRDSAGIRIVELSDLDRPPADWRLASEPQVVIGSLDGLPTQQLFSVFDAARLPDGRILVANSGTFELRVYSPEGQHLSSIGAEGDGPGEFRSLWLIDVVGGDSIYVWDQRAMRVSVLDLDGRFARSFQLAVPGERSVPRYQMSFNDGSCLVGVTRFASGPLKDRSVSTASTTLMHYDSEGQPIDTIVAIPNEPTYRIMHPDGQGISFFPLPFAPGGTWALEGMRIHEGTGETYEIRTYDQLGQLTRILRAPIAPIRITDALLESYVAERLAASSDDEEWQDLLRSAYADMPHTDVGRIFDALATDTDGRLWVRRTSMPRDSLRRWDVFGREGRHAAQAHIPVALRVQEFGSDFVLAIRRDDLDAEQVVLFRLEKP